MQRSRRSRPVLLDAGGARRRQQAAYEQSRREKAIREANEDRLKHAAGRIPVLNSINQVVEYASEVREFYS
jgi:hypothetical protein